VLAFISMLKVALIEGLMATFVAPVAGTADSTDGTVTVSWPHPATKTTNKAARQYEILNLYLRIRFLLPSLGGTASIFRPSVDQARNAGTAHDCHVSKARSTGLC
jgi:hypothetical protein